MAAWEVVALNTTVPQLMAPQTGDTYSMPRDVSITGTLMATTRIQVGGATSSFPAFQNAGAVLECILADNSNYATLKASVLQATAYGLVGIGTAIPAGGSANVAYRASSTTTFGVYFGSGAPSVSAAKGSLYLRSDGSAVNNRAYINTDGSTTWTALTTVG
jgi:hypothetical protein